METIKTGASRAGRSAIEGKRRQYVVANDVHEWIMAHGGGKYITETMRTIKAIKPDNE